LGFTKIAIIYNNADEYSTGIMEAFVEEAESKGAEIVANEAFVTDDVDFKTQLTSIKATDAEVIFVPAYYQDATYITQQAKDLGMELPFLGSDGWDGVLSTVTDPTTVEDAVFLSPFLASDPAVADFVSAYEDAYGATPDQFAADGYDTVYVIKAAMEQAGSIESADLIAAMTEIQVDGLTGSVKFTADGEPEKGAKFVVIKDGEYTAK
ncbi:MAG: ABC transporter substrate-binding protein, partial [Oscillospiraceae bacterium]|nr:ABC transporter substrate-binding protein [Oscillospiraceae bacterium]